MAEFGKKSKYRDQSEIPPQVTPVQRLMDIINDRRNAEKSHPAMMPEQQQDAANWWMTKQEPVGKWEKATLEWSKPKRNTEARTRYWKTPYADRLSETLSAFYKLTHAEQLYILDLHSQGIWWRGDSIDFMKKRASVTPEMIVDKNTLMKVMKRMIYRAA